jgi:hypothetical protein
MFFIIPPSESPEVRKSNRCAGCEFGIDSREEGTLS